MVRNRIDIPNDKIVDFCRRHRIRRLALFGSVLRDDFSPESDVDVLVDYEPGATPSLIGAVGQEMELSAILGRKADMRTAGDLSPYFRDQVIRASEPQYVAG